MDAAASVHVDAAARQGLLSALAMAVSPNQSHLEEARLQLDHWEQNSAFWRVLLDICFDQNLQIPGELLDPQEAVDPSRYEARRTAIRTVGIIRFKNGVDKYWRLRVVNRVAVTISKEEKDVLRAMLLRCIDEPERGVALQAAVSIARIARNDFPNAWPDLFDVLQQVIVAAHGALQQLGAPETQAGNPAKAAECAKQTLRLNRAVDIVQRTLKELDTVRIMAGKLRMTEVSIRGKRTAQDGLINPLLPCSFRTSYSQLYNPCLHSISARLSLHHSRTTSK